MKIGSMHTSTSLKKNLLYQSQRAITQMIEHVYACLLTGI